MADELSKAKDGLKARLDTITDLRVYRDPPAQVNEFPCAIIQANTIDYAVAMRGNAIEGTMFIHLLMAKFDPQGIAGYEALDPFLNPVGASSIRAAMQADITWKIGVSATATVDWGKLRSAEEIGRREVFGGDFVGTRFTVDYGISIA